MKILIVFYSAYGHIYKMAQAIEEGVKQVVGAETVIKRVAETLPPAVLKETGIEAASKIYTHIPIATLEDLKTADGIIFGTPTRFGNMCAQMRTFMDSTGPLWIKGSMIGKVGSVFTSTATQLGGQESTILSFHTTLLHHGMIIVGLPYSFQAQMRLDEVSGCSPYGSSTIAGGQGERMPSETELSAARFQGKHVAEITKKLIL